MALGFTSAKGSAIKDKADSFTPKDGKNTFRIVGPIIARYVYWFKGENNKNIPVECLAFNRETEKFDNAEKDWVKEYFPDLKCTWAYVAQGFQPGSDKLEIWNLKKKLTEEIITIASDKDLPLGDPTDIETGWDIIFNKKKTGPLPINVGYTLVQMALKPRALTPEERELIAGMKDIDTILPRPTAEKQKEFLDKLKAGTSESIDEEVSDEFDVK